MVGSVLLQWWCVCFVIVGKATASNINIASLQALRQPYYSGHLFTYLEHIEIKTNVESTMQDVGEIPFYTRNFRIDRPLDALEIDLSIPLVGNSAGASRSRIFLQINNETVADATMFNPIGGEYGSINLSALMTEVKVGTIELKVMAGMDKGTLHLPSTIPSKVEPSGDAPLIAKLYLLGHPGSCPF